MKEINKGDYHLKLATDDESLCIESRYDGCIHIERFMNGYSLKDLDNPVKVDRAYQERDYLHICDIDEFIKLLEEVKKKSRLHFQSDDWPNT